MSIKRVRIKNFRSILTSEFDTTSLNILVGRNDEGKSNYLRALDLFFNNKIAGKELNWDENYNLFAPIRKNRAKEIVIELLIAPPKGFKDQRPIVWEKRWRQPSVLHSSRIYYEDGAPVNSRTKIQTYLQSIRFDYVPAIKGPEYFSELLTKVHDMLTNTVEKQIRAASSAFTDAINNNTQQISMDLEFIFGSSASIQLPSDLRDLFSKLEFTSNTHGQSFPLHLKGDGIKVRYIPVILKWLADQANTNTVPGKPRVFSIWGYEEPENNVEMMKTFDLANDFISLSEDIQIFITTHSPVIYATIDQNKPNSRIFHIIKENGGRQSTINNIDALGMSELDTSLGLMALIQPHLQSYKQKIAVLEDYLSSIKNDKATIFVEGPTDKKIFDFALKHLYPQIHNDIRIVYSTVNGGGHTWVSDMLIAWQHSRAQVKAVGVFDKDPDAITSYKNCMGILETKGSRTAFPVFIEKAGVVLDCVQNGIKLPYAIEELLPIQYWEYAQAQGWLLQRNPNLLIDLNEVNTFDRSLVEQLTSKLPSPQHAIVVFNEFNKLHKEAFVNYVVQRKGSNADIIANNLKRTIDAIIAKLGIPKPE